MSIAFGKNVNYTPVDLIKLNIFVIFVLIITTICDIIQLFKAILITVKKEFQYEH